MRWHSFWTPAVVLNRCAVLLDHNNAQVSWKYGTARAELNFAHKRCKFCMAFAQNSCLTTITLLRGPNIIVWSHVLCQVHHPFKIWLPAKRPGYTHEPNMKNNLYVKHAIWQVSLRNVCARMLWRYFHKGWLTFNDLINEKGVCRTASAPAFSLHRPRGRCSKNKKL